MPNDAQLATKYTYHTFKFIFLGCFQEFHFSISMNFAAELLHRHTMAGVASAFKSSSQMTLTTFSAEAAAKKKIQRNNRC